MSTPLVVVAQVEHPEQRTVTDYQDSVNAEPTMHKVQYCASLL